MCLQFRFAGTYRSRDYGGADTFYQYWVPVFACTRWMWHMLFYSWVRRLRHHWFALVIKVFSCQWICRTPSTIGCSVKEVTFILICHGFVNTNGTLFRYLNTLAYLIDEKSSFRLKEIGRQKCLRPCEKTLYVLAGFRVHLSVHTMMRLGMITSLWWLLVLVLRQEYPSFEASKIPAECVLYGWYEIQLCWSSFWRSMILVAMDGTWFFTRGRLL